MVPLPATESKKDIQETTVSLPIVDREEKDKESDTFIAELRVNRFELKHLFSPSTANLNLCLFFSIVRLVVPRFDLSNRAELSDIFLSVFVLHSSNIRLELDICQ
jgi:hypothetical protein